MDSGLIAMLVYHLIAFVFCLLNKMTFVLKFVLLAALSEENRVAEKLTDARNIFMQSGNVHHCCLSWFQRFFCVMDVFKNLGLELRTFADCDICRSRHLPITTFTD